MHIRDVSCNVLLQQFADRHALSASQLCSSAPHQLELWSSSDGFHLAWHKSNQSSNTRGKATRPLQFHIDISHAVARLRSYPAPKQGAFNQALGKKARHILDATGGWGSDAILMTLQGHRVTVIERNPIMALLLTDAMRRLSATEWAEANNVEVPNVINANAIAWLKVNPKAADCVYLDPMFPPKRKTSAAVNKNIQLLQWLVGEDKDASDLLDAALSSNVARVTVKRPDYAESLLRQPDARFSSKLIHYDVYFPSADDA